MKKIYLFIFFTATSYLAQAQVKIGDNPTNVGASSALELESSNKALVLTRVANTAAVSNPVNGMIIYDISSKCIKSYENGTWTKCLSNGSNIKPSTNGTAVVSSYVCTTGSTGTLSAGVQVSGVTQTITANVTQLGTYSFNAFADGVVFSASGMFTSLGSQTVVLTAIGTPVTPGSTTFTLNTTPNCSFNRITQGNPSSGGTAVVSAYTCATASAGSMVLNEEVLGVTQTITATVTTPGTYNITATTNGVTFNATGTITAAGSQNIVLNAMGTPTTAGSNSFTLNTTPSCSFTRGVIGPTSGGTAIVSAYNCSGASTGTLTQGTVISGVSKTITVTVTAPGTYNISIPAVNNITWTASGTFTGTGPQPIILQASGTPSTATPTTFTLPTTPSCSFTLSVGKPFSSTVCSTFFGGTTSFPATTTVSGRSVTITRSSSGAGSLSNGAECGLPAFSGTTLNANTAITYSFSQPLENVQVYSAGNNSNFGFEGHSVSASLAGVPVPVQLVPLTFNTCASDYTTAQSGNIAAIRNQNGSGSTSIAFNISSAGPYDTIIVTTLGTNQNRHALAMCNATAVPNTTSGGTAVIASVTCNTANRGVLIQGRNSAASGEEPIAQTLTVNVTTVGSYSFSATANGVTFAASGTFTATGNNNIVLVASGVPTAAGTHVYTLNTTPSCSFNRETVSSFTRTNCGAFNGVYPASYTVSSQTVNVTKSPNTGVIYNSPFPNSNCIGSYGVVTGSTTQLVGNASITYTFSRNLNNVQILSSGNEYQEAFEGLTVSATKDGVSVPVYLVSLVNDCMQQNVITSTSGNTASIRNYRSIDPALALSYIVNVSCPTGYDTLTVTRAGDVSGNWNTHGLRFCNAVVVP